MPVLISLWCCSRGIACCLALVPATNLRLPVFRRAGLNTTVALDSEGPSVRVLENHSCFFFVLHLSMLLKLGLLLLLALPASVDAGGASLPSRRLCLEFSPAPVLLLE